MIEVKSISKRFGSIQAVDNVSFKVAKGDVLGFLGPNGAGKSTTIKMMAGFLSPTEGSVVIDGTKDIADHALWAKSVIGYMPESTPAYKDMTVTEYLAFIAEVHEMTNIPTAISEIVERTNLESVRNQLIDTLSKGFRSRLCFAAAIIHDPPILLLDEPTDGLDPNQKNEIRELIKVLSKDKAIIVSTHILEEVEAMCNRVVIISEGKLLLDGTPKDLQDRADNNHKVVVSISPDDKAKVEKVLAIGLDGFGPPDNGFNRYILKGELEPGIVIDRLSKESVTFKEVFLNRAPLDSAFRKLTRTKE